MKKEFTNQLIHETSAYLLQHAHNPVNWYPWSDEALNKAKQEDKPVLVSIGYSACHWCHVMEKESFEDEETAALMNRYFINIKIDREERPDLDHIYMDAVQTITGSGGWPLNVFLTPDLKPFYGGTYFPPVAAFNRNSWKEILTAVANTYQTKKNEINTQAQNLIEHILNLNAFKNSEADDVLNDAALKTIAGQLLMVADQAFGGFGNAPKFPQTFSLLYLLRHYYFFGDEATLKHATSSLDNMMMGGIYDQVGGGFARYSTDRQWKIPHFEKMLYDNALLIETFTEAYQLTGKKQYAQVIEETIQFIKREFTSPGGGFYSALDADSEGIEGKYYVWTKPQITELLKNDSEVFCSVYNITADGNWEGSNILWMPEQMQTIADVYNLNEAELQSLLKKSRQILFEERQKRVRPLLDTKIILAWNALMIKSLCKAYAAFGDEMYLNMAENAMAFIEEHMHGVNNIFYHSWNKTLNKQEAFLDDYAALIQAYIHLSQVKPDAKYLLKAKQLCERVTESFDDEEGIHFYFTKINQSDIIIRKKEMYDGATPSGNALMAENFLYISTFFNDASLKQRAQKMSLPVKNLVEKYPLSFGYWALHFQTFIKGFKEIVITGSNHKTLLRDILKQYIPVKVIQSSAQENNYWPLLRQKTFSERTYIYLCENYSCLKPIETAENFKNLINQNISYKKL